MCESYYLSSGGRRAKQSIAFQPHKTNPLAGLFFSPPPPLTPLLSFIGKYTTTRDVRC